MRRHLGTLLAGIFFIVLGVIYLADAVELWQVRPLRLWPVALIVIGLAVIFAGRSGEPAGDLDEVDSGERSAEDTSGEDADPAG